MNGNLNGKVALVTGGSRGIGAAIAKRLAHDGAAVAITYCASSGNAEALVREIEDAGGRAHAIKADAAVVLESQQAVRQTVAAFGRLDILVNNAGMFLSGPIEELQLHHLDDLIAINVRAHVVTIQEALLHLSSQGRIINLGSCLGQKVGFPNVSVYAMTKFAIAGLTQGLAHELGPRGITINNVQPGPTDTDMNPADGPDAATNRGYTAVGRHGKPSEIAAMVAYLAGPEAAFITGANLTVDGGINA